MTIVFDTSVWYAAFTSEHGLCGRIVRACLATNDVAISAHIGDELERNLRAKSRIPIEQVTEAMNLLLESTRLVMPVDVSKDACRDPNDLPVIGTAVAARADFLVTGDKDLLVLRSFSGIPILSPREFHDRFFDSRDEQVR